MTVQSTDTADKVLMISSDGHATAKMEDYRPYVEPGMREQFDEFLALYKVKGTRISEESSMRKNFDSEFVDIWKHNVLDQDRLEGTWDVERRFEEMAIGGLAAEVIFNDFGIPFELGNPLFSALNNYRMTPEQRVAGYKAFNRWLVDWISPQPHRFAGMALIAFDDVDDAMTEIRWAKENGLRGILLPFFTAAEPVFHERFEPIWSLLEELEMPANSHTAASGTFDAAMLPSSDSELFPAPAVMPHPASAAPLRSKMVFYSIHQFMVQFVWGGVFENHPNLHLVFTEAGSAWAPGLIAGMDYTWDGAFTPRSIRDLVKRPPSEYFRRQVHLGSSVFSRAEMENVHKIGVDQVTLGMDFPHPEGTWGMGLNDAGHLEYLNATVGAAKVPAEDARKILGENALKLWGFDRAKLQPVVDAHGKSMADILKVPDVDNFPRGDVGKPFGDPR